MSQVVTGDSESVGIHKRKGQGIFGSEEGGWGMRQGERKIRRLTTMVMVATRLADGWWVGGWTDGGQGGGLPHAAPWTSCLASIDLR